MVRVLIGIGGTGARVLEALVHLGAMGIGPSGDVRILLIDPDENNGNISRVKKTLTDYDSCRTGLGFVEDAEKKETEPVPKQGKTPVFTTNFDWSSKGKANLQVWSPVDVNKVPSLHAFFAYGSLKNKNAPEAHQRLGDMCDMLYPKKELTMPWDKGFRGRPAVGAPVMARIKDALGKSPWQELVADVKSACSSTAGEARIFVVGSIFGATGASGFPAVAKLLRTEAKEKNWPNPTNLLLGGAPMLPYFAYNVPPDEEQNATKVFARPENFLVNTAAALTHYGEAWQGKSPYNAVYLLGNPERDRKGQGYAVGGDKQTNLPHFIEMYAALAACDFFTAWKPGDESDVLQQFEVGTAHEKSIGWDDVPTPGFKRAALSFSTFAFAYLGFYFPLLAERLEAERAFLPWFIDKFKMENELSTLSAQDHRGVLKTYLESYVRWFREVHRTTEMNIRLLSHAALRTTAEHEPDYAAIQLEDEHFSALRYQELGSSEDNYHPEFPNGYDRVWEEVCAYSARGSIESLPIPRATAMGKFAYLLYTACSNYARDNYLMWR